MASWIGWNEEEGAAAETGLRKRSSIPQQEIELTDVNQLEGGTTVFPISETSPIPQNTAGSSGGSFWSSIADAARERGMGWDDYGFDGMRGAIACAVATFIVAIAMLIAFIVSRDKYNQEIRIKELTAEKLIDDSEDAEAEGKHDEDLWQELTKAGMSLAKARGAKAHALADLEALASALTAAISLLLLGSLIHFFLKRQFPRIYRGRRQEIAQLMEEMSEESLDKLGDGEPSFVINFAGLDAWMLLEFHTLCCRILVVIGAPIITGLVPIHFGVGDRHDLGILSRLSISSMPDGNGAYWVHALMVWFVMLTCSQLIYRAHGRFLALRFAWLSSLPYPRNCTLMVENIPKEFRSDTRLAEYFRAALGQHVVDRTFVVRKTSQQKKHMEELDSIQDKLLHAREQWEQAGNDPARRPMVTHNRELVDAITEYEKQREQALRVVEAAQDRLETKAVSEHEAVACEACSAAGFVTFTSRTTLLLAAQRTYREDRGEMFTSYTPDPADILYEDLKMDPGWEKGKQWLGWMLVAILFMISGPFVYCVASITNLEDLSKKYSFLEDFVMDFPIWRAVIEGVLSTVALKFLMSVIAKALLLIFESFYHLRAGVWTQRFLQQWYFFFQLIFVVLLTGVGRELEPVVVAIISNPRRVLQLLEQKMPDASNFFMSYIVLGWTLFSLELVRIPALAKYLGFRHVMAEEEAYTRAQNEDAAMVGIATRMVKAEIMMILVLVFCLCTPLICIVGWIYFAIGRTVYRHLLISCEHKKPDLGGEFWVMSLNHLFIGLVIFGLLMIAILGDRCSSIGPPILASCAFLGLYQAWTRLERLHWRSLPIEAVVSLDAEKDPKSTVLGAYIQPECVRRSIAELDTQKPKTNIMDAEFKRFKKTAGASQQSAPPAAGVLDPTATFESFDIHIEPHETVRDQTTINRATKRAQKHGFDSSAMAKAQAAAKARLANKDNDASSESAPVRMSAYEADGTEVMISPAGRGDAEGDFQLRPYLESTATETWGQVNDGSTE